MKVCTARERTPLNENVVITNLIKKKKKKKSQHIKTLDLSLYQQPYPMWMTLQCGLVQSVYK
jgi:hypothetical protein